MAGSTEYIGIIESTHKTIKIGKEYVKKYGFTEGKEYQALCYEMTKNPHRFIYFLYNDEGKQVCIDLPQTRYEPYIIV